MCIVYVCACVVSRSLALSYVIILEGSTARQYISSSVFFTVGVPMISVDLVKDYCERGRLCVDWPSDRAPLHVLLVAPSY